MSEPALTATNGDDLDATLVVNGRIDIRKTHPNLWRMVMTLAVGQVLLAVNFFWLKPTFEVYHASNWIWGAVFLALGVAKIVFLNFYRRLIVVRAMMASAIGFFLFFGIGTCEPWLDGEGSLQLPIMYLGMALVQLPMLVEPFLNPWTARRGK